MKRASNGVVWYSYPVRGKNLPIGARHSGAGARVGHEINDRRLRQRQVHETCHVRRLRAHDQHVRGTYAGKWGNRHLVEVWPQLSEQQVARLENRLVARYLRSRSASPQRQCTSVKVLEPDVPVIVGYVVGSPPIADIQRNVADLAGLPPLRNLPELVGEQVPQVGGEVWGAAFKLGTGGAEIDEQSLKIARTIASRVSFIRQFSWILSSSDPNSSAIASCSRLPGNASGMGWM